MLFGTFYSISNHQWSSNKILLSTIINLINLSSTNYHFLTTFCSHWDICALPCLLHDLDSHQSPPSLLSVIACLNLFQSSSQLHHILEPTSHTSDDTLLVYNLVTSASLDPFQSDFVDYVSIPVHDTSEVNEVIGIRTLSTSLLTPKDNLSTYHKWLITYHHLKFAFLVLKSFIRIVEEWASSFKKELKKEHGFSLGGSVNIAGCHFSDALFC